MSKSQIAVLSVCVALCLGIFLLFTNKKPKDRDKDKAPMAQDDGHEHPEAEVLNIEEYIADVNSRIEDKVVREKIEHLTTLGSYSLLLEEYKKLDKPLAIAYYSVKLAEREPTVEHYVQAGDYNSILLQSAPDAKAKNYLSGNAILCYEKAVEKDSTKTENKLRLASAYIEGGSQPMQGVTILLNIVRKDSNNVDAQLMLGRFGIVSGQYEKAIVRLEKILYLQPQNSEALLLLAEAYNGTGNVKKALELLERCKKTVKSPELRKEIENYIQQLKKPS